jgi:catechol 2,3-dioxygenase
MQQTSIDNQKSSISTSPIASVEFLTADIQRAAAFYANGLGFIQKIRDDGSYAFSADPNGRELIVLYENRQAARRPRGTAGLYHIAIRVPSRAELGRLLFRLSARGVKIHGGADHGVSEALYLADHDGNGIELYVDRPAEKWAYNGNHVIMVTEALDEESLLSAAGPHPNIDASIHPETVIGHVHLQVTSLSAAEQFYAAVLGMDVTQRNFPGALFLSYDGYHHHIGLNVWESLDGVKNLPDRIGFRRLTLALPKERFDRIYELVRNEEVQIIEKHPSMLLLHDHDGIEIQIVPEHSHIQTSNIQKVHYA